MSAALVRCFFVHNILCLQKLDVALNQTFDYGNLIVRIMQTDATLPSAEKDRRAVVYGKLENPG